MCDIVIDYNQTLGLPNQVVCKKSETYRVIETDPETTGAKCLDGSNYKFLIHEGSGTGAKNFFFYFQGAAFCGADGTETLASCYERSLTNVGSSNDFGANGTIFEKNLSMGYVSSDRETNPTFYNWNIMYITYCDGTNGQGYLENPLMFEDTYPLWFRGFNNTLSVYEYARRNMNLFDAEEVLIAGSSSGGTSAMTWAAYLQDYFPKNVKLMGFSDGGLFLDIYNNASQCYIFRFFMQNLAYLLNSNSSELYRKCPYKASIDDVWKCMVPQYFYQTIEIPFFISNSQNDIEQLATQYGVYCLVDGGPLICRDQEKRQITKFREQHLKLALKIKKEKPTWGFWLRTCFEHTYEFTWAWYGESMNVFNAEVGISMSLKNAIDYWHSKGYNRTNDASFIDMLDWNHNPNCVYDDLYRNN